jgi:hypothetical protein
MVNLRSHHDYSTLALTLTSTRLNKTLNRPLPLVAQGRKERKEYPIYFSNNPHDALPLAAVSANIPVKKVSKQQKVLD